MVHHVILGAGGIGRATAAALMRAGDSVDVVSRSGRDPGVPGARAVRLDVTDAAALTSALHGAATVVNALNPAAYTTWERDWPPMANAILDAAERARARLVTVSNLYLYGRVDAPMTEPTPVAPNGSKGQVRARMWSDALARHDAGRLEVAEVRGSDYIGPWTLATSLFSGMVLPRLLQGKTGWMPMGRRDMPHSWTVDSDVAALVAALARTDDPADLGRAWHVPTDAPRTVDELVALARAAAGGRFGTVRTLPRSAVTLGGTVVPILGELRETRHQLEGPFVLDSSAAQARFGLVPTTTADAVAQTVAAVRGQAG